MRKNIAFKHPTLRLRDNSHQVEIIIPNGTTQPVLGTRHPGDDDLRASTVEHAGGTRRSPRQQPQAAIELPLRQRTQTILTHRLPRAVQERLNGGGVGGTQSRLDDGDSGTEPLVVPEPAAGS